MDDERHLIRRVIEGTPEAEEEFVQRYSGLVLGLAIGRFHFSHDAAEEILQATMARLWDHDRRALRAWRGRGKFTSYLTVIVTRFCLQQRHIEQTRPEDAMELELLSASDPSPAADSLLSARQRLGYVEETIGQLSPRDRLLLAMRFADERTPSEISAVLGLTPGGARKALHDALQRLRSKLTQRQPELFAASTNPGTLP